MNWSKEGKVTICMIQYSHQVLEELIEEIKKSSVTPLADYLIKVREKMTRLNSLKNSLLFSITQSHSCWKGRMKTPLWLKLSR